MHRILALTTLLTLAASSAQAGGAWVPAAGDGDARFGFSRKTANTSWNANGDVIQNSGRFKNHDFRYYYAAGEAGLGHRFAFTYLVTYLYGLEGPDDDLHKNAGFSDAWLGLRYGIREGETPMAVNLTVRTPALYDIDGPYSLELVDDDGSTRLSPEWRGLLKHDVTLSGVVSRSFRQGEGWGSAEVGYTWREGAPADQLPVFLEGGWTLPWKGVRGKLAVLYVQSLGNDSEAGPTDRFSARPTFNFNDASMGRVGLSLLVPVGSADRWMLEAGFNKWVWGRSARRYDEPFLSLARRF